MESSSSTTPTAVRGRSLTLVPGLVPGGRTATDPVQRRAQFNFGSPLTCFAVRGLVYSHPCAVAGVEPCAEDDAELCAEDDAGTMIAETTIAETTIAEAATRRAIRENDFASIAIIIMI
jgi:hypothetical protein